MNATSDLFQTMQRNGYDVAIRDRRGNSVAIPDAALAEAIFEVLNGNAIIVRKDVLYDADAAEGRGS